MASIPTLIVTAVSRRLAGLRFPTLFLILAGVFALDLLIPDFVPFVDELLLGLATLLVGRLRKDFAEPGDR